MNQEGKGTVIGDGEYIKGSSVTLTASPAEGYDFAGWYVDGKLIMEDATYTFIAEKAVNVVAKFTEKGIDDPSDKTSETNPFTDVQENDYYFNPVKWAVFNEITIGTSSTTFSPEQDCTRAQMVTFLWRAKGSPEPSSTSNPFTDVKSDAYYAKAVLWAAEQGITTGTSLITFSPDATVNRAQSVTFLWRMEGSEKASVNNQFTDVDANAYYSGAVDWAVRDQITTGKTDSSFAPEDACTRGQIVTFLYRDMVQDA